MCGGSRGCAVRVVPRRAEILRQEGEPPVRADSLGGGGGGGGRVYAHSRYYLCSQAARCKACPSWDEMTWRFALVAGVAGLFCVVLFVGRRVVAWLALQKRNKPARNLVRLGRKLQALGRVFSLVPKFKIAFGFYQVATSLERTYGVVMPATFTRWTRFLDSTSELNWWSAFATDSRCAFGDYAGELLATALAPLIVVLFALVSSATAQCAALAWRERPSLLRCSDSAPEQKLPPLPFLGRKAGVALLEAAQDGLIRSAPFCLLVIFCFLPNVSMAIFQINSCAGYWYDDGNGADGIGSTKHFYLRRQGNVRCSPTTEAHEELVVLMWGLAAIWPIGGVIALALLLWSVRRRLECGRGSRLVSASRFLHNDYRASFYAWELVVLSQRTVLTGWVLLISDERAFLRLVVGLLASLLVGFLMLALQPYRQASNLMLAAAQQLLLVFVFLGAMIVRVRAVLIDHVSLDVIYSVVGFKSEDEAVWWMLLSFLSMLIVVAGTLLYQIISRHLTRLSHNFGIEPSEMFAVLRRRTLKHVVGKVLHQLAPLLRGWQGALLCVRGAARTWVAAVLVTKLCLTVLLLTVAAQQAAEPCVWTVLPRAAAAWMTFSSLVSFVVSWRSDSQVSLLYSYPHPRCLWSVVLSIVVFMPFYLTHT